MSMVSLNVNNIVNEMCLNVNVNRKHDLKYSKNASYER